MYEPWLDPGCRTQKKARRWEKWYFYVVFINISSIILWRLHVFIPGNWYPITRHKDQIFWWLLLGRDNTQTALVPATLACLISMTATTHLPCSEFSPTRTLPEGLRFPELSAGKLGGESQPEGKSACGSLNRNLGATGRVSEEKE